MKRSNKNKLNKKYFKFFIKLFVINKITHLKQFNKIISHRIILFNKNYLNYYNRITNRKIFNKLNNLDNLISNLMNYKEEIYKLSKYKKSLI